jgi:ADP-heptose:LPS heptosyltransferase
MKADDTLHALKEAKHILVIKLRYLGDSIWMLPFVENLKRNLPHVRVSVLVNKGTEAFFYTCPSVDNVIPFPRQEIKGSPAGIIKFLSFLLRLRRLRPDVVLELTDADRPAIISFFSGAKVRVSYNNENRWRRHLYTHIVKSKINAKHMVEYHLDVLRELGMKIYDDSIKIHVSDEAFQSLRRKMPSVFDESEKKKVLIHPGARNSLRQWGAEKFAYLADTLSDVCRIFLVAGPGEGAILEKICGYMKTEPEVCSRELNLYEFAALCELSDMFIGNDSAPIHIASAKTFTVGIYGPTLPEIISPWTKRKLTFFDSTPLPCRPCRQEGCSNVEFKACIERIKPEEVVSRVREVLTTI